MSEQLPAWRSPRAWLTLLAVFALALSADLWSKAAAFERVAPYPVVLEHDEVSQPLYRVPWHDGIRAISPDLLDFRLVVNHGAVFGIGQNARGVFVAFTIIAVVAGVFVFGWWTRSESFWAHVAIGLILAGGIGNLYDRVCFGAVRDFLYMFPRRHLPWQVAWPNGSTELFPWVFNVADMLLLAGMAILIFHARKEDHRRADAQQAREGV